MVLLARHRAGHLHGDSWCDFVMGQDAITAGQRLPIDMQPGNPQSWLGNNVFRRRGADLGKVYWYRGGF